MNTDAQPHAPRCCRCGHEKHRSAPSPWCERCERKMARMIRQTAAALVTATRRGDGRTADALVGAITRLASW